MSHHFPRLNALVVLSVLAGLATPRVEALPEGPVVRFGNARFDNPAAGVLDITNSTKAIIDWQDFPPAVRMWFASYSPAAAVQYSTG